ncbi:hypothetical protein SERLA73DRAFT_78653 [Serpula lacrymans var. lacrymans S7.3]|uniref:Uncharacterized protein n=2 Tax=Serpula lacrymans var. lacrymans TaxID=341189 RepID=F8QDX0_SERL3|nr:uncharacterized protein SERLADRAFT_443700 [Serpula lacrymans var. lacrymans S7.9]EGN93345.1 hypothetical protein SERLA73DRAFT_78653 [Serpula lacrymans var. lacrymans S7.3]EGO18730.1 hypothetical protein SERLADRAFT_443700 [Serpula lacrymans var. lacrymans S7.9]
MAAMLDCIKAFVKSGKPHYRQETLSQLQSQFIQASHLNCKTKVTNIQTESGIKDTYQKHFIDKNFCSYKHLRGFTTKQAALDSSLALLPANIFSPVWHIKG